MTLPGFTAETSLYRTSGHYRTASAQARINGIIYPAQLDRSGWDRNKQTLKKAWMMGTSCVPAPNNPSCQQCTYRDQSCNVVFTWYNCDLRFQCSPMTFCNPDPLNRFCDICTELDENCRLSNPYQSCIGVKRYLSTCLTLWWV
jgi:hypothetical protein